LAAILKKTAGSAGAGLSKIFNVVRGFGPTKEEFAVFFFISVGILLLLSYNDKVIFDSYPSLIIAKCFLDQNTDNLVFMKTEPFEVNSNEINMTNYIDVKNRLYFCDLWEKQINDKNESFSKKQINDENESFSKKQIHFLETIKIKDEINDENSSLSEEEKNVLRNLLQKNQNSTEISQLNYGTPHWSILTINWIFISLVLGLLRISTSWLWQKDGNGKRVMTRIKIIMGSVWCLGTLIWFYFGFLDIAYFIYRREELPEKWDWLNNLGLFSIARYFTGTADVEKSDILLLGCLGVFCYVILWIVVYRTYQKGKIDCRPL